jgi:hypothetical protein
MRTRTHVSTLSAMILRDLLARNKCGYAPRDAHADQSRQQTITANEIERLKNATRRTSETRDAAMKRKGYVTNGHRYLRLPDIKA